MTIYQYLSCMPTEHISILQANGVLHKHTMRDLQIYRDFIRFKREYRHERGSAAMAYTQCEKLSGYGNTVCRGAIRKMETELPIWVKPPAPFQQNVPKSINETISQDF